MVKAGRARGNKFELGVLCHLGGIDGVIYKNRKYFGPTLARGDELKSGELAFYIVLLPRLFGKIN
ncbi:MAG: hypothetical protein UY36_C0023G0008 [Parcubacteria group bacterium GW2011_GWA1_49_11]|nr:MAG: hypothetical protein UY36_C0023G0008 [Parcubacteria group bacterium GW2011_GWA1_49_11]